MALAHLQQLGLHEGERVHGRVVLRAELAKEVEAARDAPRLEQSGLDGHVLGRLGQAFAQGAHAGANLQATVPALADEGLKLGLQTGCLLGALSLGQEHQHIDIGVREQLAAAKAADGHQAQIGRKACTLPECDQQLIDQGRELAQAPA